MLHTFHLKYGLKVMHRMTTCSQRSLETKQLLYRHTVYNYIYCDAWKHCRRGKLMYIQTLQETNRFLLTLGGEPMHCFVLFVVSFQVLYLFSWFFCISISKMFSWSNIYIYSATFSLVIYLCLAVFWFLIFIRIFFVIFVIWSRAIFPYWQRNINRPSCIIQQF